MANFLKVVFLGLMAFAVLVFLTADKPKQIVADDNVINIVKYEALPNSYELVGKDKNVTKEDLFGKINKTLIIVGNHDSLAVVKDFNKFFDLNIPFVIVANISSAPWFVKKLFIPSKLKELNKGSKIPMIYDFNGKMVKVLNITNSSKTKFTAFVLTKDGAVSKIYEGDVKPGALDGTMTKKEKIDSLKPLFNLISNK